MASAQLAGQRLHAKAKQRELRLEVKRQEKEDLESKEMLSKASKSLSKSFSDRHEQLYAVAARQQQRLEERRDLQQLEDGFLKRIPQRI